MPETIQAVLIGAGQRGADVYGAYALRCPERVRFVAVAEPDPERRKRFAARHHIPAENQFGGWEPLLASPRFGRAALVCTQDQAHTGPALAALKAGYAVLLEKPMATTADECRLLVEAAEAAGRQLHVCHVLRYTRHFQKLRAIVQSGILGQIVVVDHHENVSSWHMAHSYVRGNWSVSARSSPMILAKCCHDFDLLLWILDGRCQYLSSVGGLTHFRPENAPPDAPAYCLDGCPAADACPYYAPYIYVDLLPFWRGVAESGTGWVRLAARAQQIAPGLVRTLGAGLPTLRQVSEYRGWPRSVVAHDPEPESLLAALRRGPYGRCVYHGDNDVVDHQVVIMAFEGGLSVTLTMNGHAAQDVRITRIAGARASLHARFGIAGSWIEVREHRSGRRRRYDTGGPAGEGHGGGDAALMEAFLLSLDAGASGPAGTIRQVLEAHLLAFAAEEARRERRVVHMRV